MLGPRVGYELPTTTHSQKVHPAPSPHEGRENRLTTARAEIPHGREVGMEESHTATENTKSRRPSQRPRSKKRQQVAKGYQRQHPKLHTESRTQSHETQSTDRWLEGVGTMRAGVGNVQAKGRIRSEKSCGLGLPR